jgi:hypothetical protein
MIDRETMAIMKGHKARNVIPVHNFSKDGRRGGLNLSQEVIE